MLDMRTVLAITIAYSLFSGVGIIIFGLKRKSELGIVRIGLGIVLTGIGFFVLSMRYYLPQFVTVVVSNFLIILGISQVRTGLSKFRKFNYKWYFQDIVLLSILLVSFIYFTYVNPSIESRIIIVSLINIIYFIEIIFLFTKKRTTNIIKESFLINMFFLISILILIVRIIITIYQDSLESFMLAGFVHSLSVMIYQVMPLVITIGTFWISNSLMERKLEDISRIDSLTGVYNRSAFMLLSEGIFDNEKTRNRFYGLAMCDLDKFKQVNDSYGHIAGDGVLKHVARIISENIRGEDILGRYGGEEFVVLISVSSKETLEKILERIRYNIEKSPYKYNDQEIRVTISIGAILIKESEKDLQKYIEEADNLLYDAKHSGRNRVKI